MAANLPRLIPRVGVAALASPLEVGADRAAGAAADLAALLESLGCHVLQLGAISDPDAAAAAGRRLAEAHVHAVALAAASWFEDYLVLDLLEECAAPLLLWSLPGIQTGALCGAQQLTFTLAQLGASYRCVFGPLEAESARRRAGVFLRAAALRHRLRRARVGIAGHGVAGMGDAAADPLALKRTLGPRLVPLDLPELLERAGQVPDEDARKTWQSLLGRAGACRVGEDAGLDSMKVFAAVSQWVDCHRLDALTIGCYPHLMGRVCLAASLLADRGVPLGCEGDPNGAVGQLVLGLLTGQPTHNTDWLEPLEDGTVLFTHCGSGSFELAHQPSQITLAPVRLVDRGVCALFPARPGAVTLVNLVPRAGGYQLAVLEGEALPSEMLFPGNPLRVRFAAATDALVEWIHKEGLGHHWMAGYGHLGEEIRAWAGLCGAGLRVVEPPS